MTVKLVNGIKCLVNSLTDERAEAKEEEQRRVEFSFPFLMVRTKLFGGVFDRLGRLRVSRFASWFSLAIVPVVGAIGLFLILFGLFALLWNPAAGDFAREVGLGGVILLPGITPYLPFLYGWFGFVVTILVHEGAHGVAARSLGLRVKSSGLLFLLFVPIGAFVDVDEEQIKKAKARVSSRVMAAGVGSNVVVAVVCLIGVLLIVGGLAPVIDGAYISVVNQGSPAEASGLLPKDVFVSIDGVRINQTADLTAILGNKTSGETVNVTVARGDMWRNRFSTVVNLTASENRTVMGVSVGDLQTEERLRNYENVTLERLSMYLVPPVLAPGLVPFSDDLSAYYTSPLGPQWPVFANTLFWLWFINVNVAVFNALPIYPLDGGRMFNIALKSFLRGKEREKLISTLTWGVTAALVVVLMLTIIIPFIPR